MNKKHFMSMLSLLAVSVAGVSSANAADTNTGFYVGAGAGYSRVKFNDNAFAVAGATASSLSKDESDTGFKLFGGYQFNQNIGVELGYVDLGRFNATRTVTAPAAGTVATNIRTSGGFLDLVGTLPLQNNFSLLGKVGAIYSETKASLATTGAVALVAGVNRNPKENETNFKLGLGAQYDFTKTVGLRAEWERFFKLGKTNTTGEGDVDLYSLNLIIRF